jgi:hypothetical protein
MGFGVASSLGNVKGRDENVALCSTPLTLPRLPAGGVDKMMVAIISIVQSLF